jgi:hypothetical protein
MSAIPQEESCPVPDSLLGELYRASPAGLHALVDSIPPGTRALLALYCYRRSHLSGLALAIASTCERSDMIGAGGALGAAVFEQSRQAPKAVEEKRRKVTLSNGAFMKLIVAQDLL